ncbi:HBL211Cp [Eremothecium sinecaudum]|uniref:Guanine nucleotide exchange factor LTE1 n=1 Tax=Eremothecium sinecaudum TaxID=45286 RepID=A0A120K0V1_9SACH|nr:HBL211Cp [Eremothecium sinecaudum]AMD18691.1 HBL211Cp [Eremothecium sinecaudum]
MPSKVALMPKQKFSADVFSETNYYPTPTEKVITYAKSDTGTRKNKHQILTADIYALIASLTSPIEDVDYELFADFFLVFRKFISTEDLVEILICRFDWALQEVLGSTDKERKRIGEITLVRTFVLLRHWIINYFADDFLPSLPVRERFLTFVNPSHFSKMAIRNMTMVTNILVALKKAWVYTAKMMWSDFDPVTEFKLVTANDWLDFEIRDATQLRTPTGDRRESKLSEYALNSRMNPSFRNESILSLYNARENFQLPTRAKGASLRSDVATQKRTATMFLYPKDTLASSRPSPNLSKSDETIVASEESKPLQKISNATNVSDVIKDVAYPANPFVEVVIPPTPSKKLEFVLNSSCVPLVQDSNKNVRGKQRKARSRSGSRTISGLMSKWKLNHHRRSSSLHGSVDFSPEMNTFIKYVFCIASLDNVKDDMRELVEIDPPKFDILSARTIDEVEYLVAIENHILNRVEENTGIERTIDLPAVESSGLKTSEPREFSVIDNLNIYKTVSTIASSVYELSKLSIVQSQQDALMPSIASVVGNRSYSTTPARGRPKGAAQTPFSSKDTSPTDDDEPTKLVFFNTKGRPNDNSSAISTFLKAEKETPTAFYRNDEPYRSLKNSDVTSVNAARSSGTTIETGRSPQGDSIFGYRNEAESLRDISGPTLSRKQQHTNLREFIFESSATDLTYSTDSPRSDNHTEVSSYSNARNSPRNRSGVEKDTKEHYEPTASGNNTLPPLSVPGYQPKTNSDNVRNSIPPAIHNSSKGLFQNHSPCNTSSGRISINRKSIPALRVLTTPNTPVLDSSFMEREKKLVTHEARLNALEKSISEAKSRENESLPKSGTTSTIATSLFFLSANTSPQKDVYLQEHISEEETLDISGVGAMKLSHTPSIQSVATDCSSGSDSSNSIQASVSTVWFLSQTRPPNESHDSSKDLSNAESLLGFSSEEDKNNLFTLDVDIDEELSPRRDMNYLATKFMATIDTKESSDFKSVNETSKELTETDTSKLQEGSISDETIQRVGHSTEDRNAKVQSDPVSLALMKLEGTLISTSDTEVAAGVANSISSSELAKEVEKLDIGTLKLPNDMANKRRSMFIERRRTVAEISQSSADSRQPTPEPPSFITDEQIRLLLSEYKLQDTRLHVTNVDEHLPFILMYDSLSIAKQLTLIEREIMNEIDWKDLMDFSMEKTLPKVTSWLQLLLHNEKLSGIDLAIARFNLTVDWIISELLMTSDPKLRRNVIQRLIHVADHCRAFQNYNTVMEIVLALNSVVVQKFKESWRLIEPGDILLWKELKSIPSLDRNYQKVRNMLNSINPIKGCIPFLVVYLSDLALNSEKRDWIVPGKVVNYNKFQSNIQIVKNFIQRVQWAKFYDIQPDQELLSKCVYISTLTPEEMAQVSKF